MTIIKFGVLLIVVLAGMMFFTLHRNGANLFEEPGVVKRLGIFLTIHSASTSDNPPFDELRTPVFDAGVDKLFQLILETGSGLGWGIISHDSDNYNVNFVVRSPVLLFEDDVFVQLKSIDAEQTSVTIRSSSRIGRADFAANSGHIQALIAALKK